MSAWRRAGALIAMLMFSSVAWGAHNNPLLIGGPNALPVRKLGPARAAAPVGAHLTYYGGRVVSNMRVIQVLWGTGAAGGSNGQFLAQVRNTTTPSMATFYQQVLNSAYVDWLTEYNTDIIDSGGGQGTNQIIGRGSFVAQVAITPSDTSNPIDDTAIQTELINQILAGHLPAPNDGRGRQQQHLLCGLLPARNVHHPGWNEFLRFGWLLRLPRHDRLRQFSRRNLLRRSSRHAGRLRMRHRMRQRHASSGTIPRSPRTRWSRQSLTAKSDWRPSSRRRLPGTTTTTARSAISATRSREASSAGTVRPTLSRRSFRTSPTIAS